MYRQGIDEDFCRICDKWSLTGSKKKFLKMAAVAYKRWSLTRGSNYSDLTGDILELWLKRGGRLRGVVARGGSTV